MKTSAPDHVGSQRFSQLKKCGGQSNQIGLSADCRFREESSDEKRRHPTCVSGGAANIAVSVRCFRGRRHRGGYAEMSARPFTICAKPLSLHSKSLVGACEFALAPPATEEGDEQ